MCSRYMRDCTYFFFLAGAFLAAFFAAFLVVVGIGQFSSNVNLQSLEIAV